MNILFVTPECAPWVKTGGLGDVSGALPQALAALGHEVKLLMPAYPALGPLLQGSDTGMPLALHAPWPQARLRRARPPGQGVELLLLDCPELFQRPGGPYDDSGGDNALRFGLLCAAAAALCAEASAWRPQVLHCNDWPTGLAPALLRREGATHTRSVMTVHNLAFQGLFPLAEGDRLGLPARWLTPEGMEYWGQISFLKAGIEFADAVTTVSPTYAHEIQQPEHGMGFDGILRDRADRLSGILNGVDAAVWNPATDVHLRARYDVSSLHLKARNKQALQERFGLEPSGAPPLFGLVGRLTHQKGIDLVLENADWLVQQGAQLAMLGTGDPGLEAWAIGLARQYPGQVAVRIGYDEALAHWIEAGADAFLMPSRFEPCGLNQMYSLAYGTPPVVRATGGLADTVVDAADAARGNGFAFHDATPLALRGALERALALYRDPPRWRALQQRGMAGRFDWAQAARAYEALYREILAAPPRVMEAMVAPTMAA